MNLFKTLVLYLFLGACAPLFLHAQTMDSIRKELEAKHKTSSDAPSLEILNVSYDPTREFYEEYNPLFIKWWKERTNQDVEVIQSHGGSGKQARSVISGLEADVVSLALAYDIDSIEKLTHTIGKNWQNRLPNNSSPYYSTIVFLVRKGNPKQIKDWDDLVKDGVSIITPNPKTSGGARWSYLAAWGWALDKYKGDAGKAKEYMKQLYGNTPVLDTGARGATTTFIQRKMGDVLITWENEAYLTIEKTGQDEYEIVYPSMSIKAEPPVTWVDKFVQEKGTGDVARFYLAYLYSVPAQELIAKHYFRPVDEQIAKKNSDKFPQVKMLSIDDFGGWEKLQNEHFKDGAIFDEIYLSGRSKKTE